MGLGTGPDPAAAAELINAWSQLIVGLAWPAVVLFVLIRFRGIIQTLADAVRTKISDAEEGSLSAGNFASLSWKSRIQRTERNLDALPAKRTASDTNVIINENRLPAAEPTDVLNEARAAVRSSLIAAGAKDDHGEWLGPLADSLQRAEKLDRVVVDAVFVLDDLYQIARLNPSDVDGDKVTEYVQLARRVVERVPPSQ